MLKTLQFIAVDKRPLRVVDGFGFRNLCFALNPAFTVPSHHYLSKVQFAKISLHLWFQSCLLVISFLSSCRQFFLRVISSCVIQSVTNCDLEASKCQGSLTLSKTAVLWLLIVGLILLCAHLSLPLFVGLMIDGWCILRCWIFTTVPIATLVIIWLNGWLVCWMTCKLM